MKKLVMSLSLCLLLVGCGNKLTCTREGDEGKEKIQISFKDGKASKFKGTMIFESKEDAESMCEMYEKLGGEEMDEFGIKVKCSGKKLIMETTNSEYLEDYEGTKEEIKEEFEEDGYKCK